MHWQCLNLNHSRTVHWALHVHVHPCSTSLMFSDLIGETLDIVYSICNGDMFAIVCKQARNYMFEGYQGSPGLYQPLPCRQQHAWTPRVPNDQRSGGDHRSFGARLCQRRRRRDDWFGWLVLAWWGFIGVAVSKGFCWWCFCEVCPCIAIQAPSRGACWWLFGVTANTMQHRCNVAHTCLARRSRGMAIAEAHLAARFNKEGFARLDLQAKNHGKTL